MTRPALFFDFFGTLVDYIPHNEDRDYPLTMALLRSQGIRVEQQAFLDLLKDTFIAHEQKAIIDDREYAWEDCAFEVLRKLRRGRFAPIPLCLFRFFKHMPYSGIGFIRQIRRRFA